MTGSYDEKIDEWSCGIILYILLCGYPPFNGPNNEKIFEAIKHSKLKFDEDDWSQISKEARSLITSLLDRNPNSRLSAKDALKHEWFDKVSKKTEIDSKKAAEALNKLKKFHVKFQNLFTHFRPGENFKTPFISIWQIFCFQKKNQMK